ncbi:NAD(P)H quinone oxidoreductase [Amylibacter marinus]|uniref:NAD(P)H quinone oxidoreductase n=1 Tax=Amylibacter marinus TaxID=1475483 RepID=A0ABQ5VWV0_9RHOB|nr:NAD(P)H-quinone oxidoreductase [Amylibacter marinus]GLQ35578.1 NAD(P)H quinone oxidoreductase [Amylibacter marinus]
MIPDTMRTVEMRQPGGYDELYVGQRGVPEIGKNQVLIRVNAAGVNGPDLVQRRGHYPPPKGASDLLGLEVSGTIVATGSGVKGWKIDDAVCALCNGGGYAEYVAVNASHCLPVPKGVSIIDAAGLCETFFTVWSNVFHNQQINKGDILLVHGGAGGIGSAAIQLAARMGMRVFTTCAPLARTYVSTLGAERAIDYTSEDFVEILRDAGGANVILDIIGGDYIAKNIKAAHADARIVQLAFNAGSKVEINLMPIMLKRLTLTGSTLRSRPDAYKSSIAADLRSEVWPKFVDGKIAPHTHAILPFEQAAEAHRQMEAGGHHGKILLVP